MNIRWIGQSGYVLKAGDTQIMIDPYLSDAVNRIAHRPRMVPPSLKPEDVRVDAIICTHDHADHLDADAIVRMPVGLHFITTGKGKDKLATLGRKNVTVLRIGESVTVGAFCITAVYAKHTVEAFGVVVRIDDKSLYFSGDTLFNEKLFSVAKYKPDAAFVCINGKLGNMNVNEAIQVAKKIGAKVNIPNHYGMFASNTEDPKKFTAYVPGGFAMEYGHKYSLEELGDHSLKDFRRLQ